MTSVMIIHAATAATTMITSAASVVLVLVLILLGLLLLELLLLGVDHLNLLIAVIDHVGLLVNFLGHLGVLGLQILVGGHQVHLSLKLASRCLELSEDIILLGAVRHELLELGVQCCLLLLCLRVIGRIIVVVAVVKVAAMSTT